MAKKTVFQYPGKNATVSWNGRLCIHVAECGRAKGDLFVGGRDPWCQPDLTTKEEVADVISRCPTGALTVNFVDGSSRMAIQSPDQCIAAVNLTMETNHRNWWRLLSSYSFTRSRLSTTHTAGDDGVLVVRLSGGV